MRPRLLVVHHSHGWRTTRMAQAIVAGALSTGEVEVLARRAAEADVVDLRNAQAYVFATPETFGSMCGLLKDFFERSYYPLLGELNGRACAIVVCAGSDGQGAVQSIARIARGHGWREVQPPLVIRSEDVEARLSECEQLGMTMALGLALGVF